MADEFISSFDGTKLFFNCETGPDDKAVVVIVHGLCEHQGRYEYFAKKLHAAGYGTYRFDHRGHGKSEGECAYLGDFNELLDDTNVVIDRAIAENPTRPVFVYGHSMGGFTVALWSAKYPGKRVAGVICNGGLTFDKGGFLDPSLSSVDPHTQLPNQLGDGVCSVQEVKDWYLEDPLNRKSFAAGLAQQLKKGIDWFAGAIDAYAYPTLITHGEFDGLISYEDSLCLFAGVRSTDKQLKIYGRSFHETINEFCRDEVIADYLHWMDRRL
jgi:lysophospholipase